MKSRAPLRAAAAAATLFVCVVAFPLHAGEPALVARQLYERFGGGDVDGARQLLVEGPVQARLKSFAGMWRARCVSIAEYRAGEVRVSGDHADVPVVASFAELDPVSGRQSVELEHAVVGMKRDGDGWKVDSWTFDEEKLVDRLLQAPSDSAAGDILAATPELLDATLLRALRSRGGDVMRRQEFDKAARIAASLHALASLTADDDALAAAYALDASIAQMQSRFDDSVRVAEEGLAVARRSGTPDTIGAALNNVARAYQFRDGNTTRAKPLYEEAWALRDRLVDQTLAQRAATQIVVYLIEHGEFRACFPYIAEARRMALENDDALGLYSVELSLAQVFESQNDHELSVPHYARAREIAEKVHFVAGYYGMSQAMARALYLLGREKEFHAAAGIALKAPGDMFNGVKALVLSDMAGLHLQHGQLKDAERVVAEALSYGDKGVDDSSKAEPRQVLASIRLAQKRYKEALDAAEQAIVYRVKTGQLTQVSAQVLAARAHLGLGQREAAYASLRTALSFGELARGAAGGSERQAALEFEGAAEVYSILVDLLVEDGKAREALLVAEKAKGRTLLDILDGVRSRAAADVPAALAGEEQRLEKQLVEANTKGDRVAIEKARLELETHRSLVDANRPRLHAARGAGELASVESLAPLLHDEKTALVEYVMGEQRLHIFIVRSGAGGPRVSVRSVAVSRPSLERLARRYVAALSRHDLDFGADASRLYELLLTPAMRVAPSARDLCIIPDGVLWGIPFESLMDRRGAFAIESRAFFYAPSATVLLREQARTASASPGNRFFLGFGNPLVETTAVNVASLTTRERAASRAPIPEAAREVETIARIVGPQSSEVFTGSAALESRAKAEASHFRVLHFATHGIIDDANPMYSYLLLSRAGGDGEDGALEAREMLDLHLNADLVVLSACDTARGGVHEGEGLIGMSWALFAAGSPSVVASQWRVDSARTETLMTTFYREWQKRRGQSFAKAHALRAARLALLHDAGGRHPYYWSPFVLIGSAD